ncbi:MAG TPA: tail fiber domain-containing protein, partial [bacterium]|nr:tail fiber domain-containing protein [bacterium]
NLWGNSPNASYGIGVQGYTQYFRSDGNFAWYIKGSHHDGELNAGGGSAAMIIRRPEGKVGIGTNSPNAKLHVPDGGILNGLAIGAEPPGSTKFSWPYETLGTINTNHNLRLHSYNAVYLHSGNKSTPSLRVERNGQVTGNFGFGFSSKEKKKAIKSLSIDEAFGLFNDLKPVKFEYKKGEGPEGSHIGFIAEDTPDALTSPDNDFIDFMDILAVLTAVVQKLQTDVEELKEKIF